jgi:hypothetical protein
MFPRPTWTTFITLLMWFLCLDQKQAFCVHISVGRKSSFLSVRGEPYTIFSSRRWSQSNKSEKLEDGVIELMDMEGEIPTTMTNTGSGDASNQAVAPFLSQGEILQETLKVDLSNPKQTRVIIYIILSLIPILFLIPLMLGSREFLPAIIPMEDMPPVQM